MIHKWKIFLFNFIVLSAAGLVFFISRPVHATIVSGDVISFWTLDEPAATGTYSDAIGGNDAGDGTGGAPDPTTAGQINGAQVFTAANTDGIDIPDNDSFDWGVGDSFSIEFWMKGSDASRTQVMVGREGAGSLPQLWIGIQNGTGNVHAYLESSDGGDVVQLDPDPDVVITDGEWHHIVLVRDASTHNVYLYVDGAEAATEPESFTAGFVSTVALNLGYMNGDFYFEGTLDEVALYNRALTVTEVQANFNATGGPRYLVDLDSDGISDGEENAGPNNGDGNSDGTLDMNQNTVTSLLTKSGTDYVTIETSAGTLASVAAVDNPSSGDVPTGLNFPWGFFNFTVNGPASATVKFYLPASSAPEKYYKYGPPTPGDPDSWYDFASDGTTGATFSNNEVTLLFVDGQRGDDTVADGSIVDQGGPATLTSAFDSDGDGISDGEENAGPNSGDGNEDGTPDMNQNTVVSLLTQSGTDYVTIETSAGTLANCAAVDNPSSGDAPSNTNFPWGFFNFTINGLTPGDPATVTMRTPAGTSPTTYYKYGPPTPGEADAWYEFTYDATTLTGAEDFTDNVVTLKFVDGQRGDDTAADGSIVDQGAPATVTSTPVSSGDGGGGGCFIATAAYGSYMEPHIMILRKFRDRFLLENSIGKAFVNFYYKYSPPMAKFISKHSISRGLVRVSLLPIVGMSWVALKLGLLNTMSLMFFFSICLIGGIIFRRKKVKH